MALSLFQFPWLCLLPWLLCVLGSLKSFFSNVVVMRDDQMVSKTLFERAFSSWLSNPSNWSQGSSIVHWGMWWEAAVPFLAHSVLAWRDRGSKARLIYKISPSSSHEAERCIASVVPALLADGCNSCFILPKPTHRAYLSVFLSHSISEQF